MNITITQVGLFLLSIILLIVVVRLILFFWKISKKSLDFIKGYIKEFQKARKGKATENEIGEDGNFISIEGKSIPEGGNGVARKETRKLFFRPHETNAYLVNRGGAFTRVVMEYKNRLFVKDLQRLLEKEDDSEEVQEDLKKVALLNPDVFPTKKKDVSGNEVSIDWDFESIKKSIDDDINEWRILTVPESIYDARFTNWLDEMIFDIAGGRRLIHPLPWQGQLGTKRFQWNEVGDQTSESFKFRDEQTNYFPMNETSYGIVIVGVEDRENLSWTVILQIQIKGVNPYQAFYGQEDWLRTLEGYISNKVTGVFLSHSYASAIEETDDSGETINHRSEIIKILNDSIMSLNDEVSGTNKKGCADVIGVLIRAVQVKQIELSDAQMKDALATSMARVFNAKQKSEEIKRLAEAKAFEIETIASAEGNRIARLNEAKPHAARILEIEALPRGLAALGGNALLNIDQKPETEEDTDE